MKNYFGLFLTFFCLCMAYAEDSHQLPDDFLYQENPVPKHYLDEFFSDATICKLSLPCKLDLTLCDDQIPSQKQSTSEDFLPSIDRQWSYIGSVGNQLHLVWAYYWEVGCMGKFTALLLVKREGSKLAITDILYGGDRHASMISEDSISIQGNTISYSQNITSAGFIDLVATLCPDFRSYSERSSKVGLAYGEACSWGSCKFQVNVSKDGKFSEVNFTSYRPAEGSTSPYKNYIKSELEKIAMADLRAIDERIDPELKDDGIAYSPILFKELLQDDLHSKSFSEKSVSISQYKNAPAPFFMDFSYRYCFKSGDCHVVKARDLNLCESLPKRSEVLGLYILKKEGDQLRRVDRITRIEGKSDYGILNEKQLLKFDATSLKFSSSIDNKGSSSCSQGTSSNVTCGNDPE